MVWLGGTAVFAWFATASYRNGSWVSFAVWGRAAACSFLMLPWKNRAPLVALVAGLLTRRKMRSIRRNDSGRSVTRSWQCGNDAVVDEPTGSIHCPACGASGTVASVE